MRGLFEWYYGLGFFTKLTIGLIAIITGYTLAMTFYGSIAAFCKSVGMTGFIILSICLLVLPFKDTLLSAWNKVWDFAADEAIKNIHRINKEKQQAKANAS